MLSGDEFYEDEITSGPLAEDDPYAWPCDQCGAEPGEDCRPWCTALPPHAQDNSGAEFGILFSHASEMVWPDLVGRAFPDEEAARAYGESVAQAQSGSEFAVMCRRADRPGWVEVGTGRTHTRCSPGSGPSGSPAVSQPEHFTELREEAVRPRPRIGGRGLTDQHGEAGYHASHAQNRAYRGSPHP